MHILMFARSGGPDEDGRLGGYKKYAFPLKCRPGGTPPMIRAILMQHFARGDIRNAPLCNDLDCNL